MLLFQFNFAVYLQYKCGNSTVCGIMQATYYDLFKDLETGLLSPPKCMGCPAQKIFMLYDTVLW